MCAELNPSFHIIQIPRCLYHAQADPTPTHMTKAFLPESLRGHLAGRTPHARDHPSRLSGVALSKRNRFEELMSRRGSGREVIGQQMQEVQWQG